MTDERVVSPDELEAERVADTALRPRTLDDFVGQSAIKNQIRILVEAARQRGDALDHVLLYGPPGLGKTTLAQIIAVEMGVNIRLTSGPALEHQGMLASILTSLEERDVFFIDEVHRLNRAVEEALYPAMEDLAFDFVAGKGAGAQTLRLTLNRFTVIGATTRAGALGAPLRDRFGVTFRLDFYDTDDLVAIANRSARLLGVDLDPEGAAMIAGRSRGTPRIVNRLLRRARDYAQVRAAGRIDVGVATAALDVLGIDSIGLDELDRRVLGVLCGTLGGHPVGVQTIAVSVQEDPDTIEDIVEPFLIRRGLLARTLRGRLATAAAYQHLGHAGAVRCAWGGRGADRALRALRAADFDYPLPAERIAQEPLAERDASRLLHVLAGGGLEDREFRDLPELLRPGDLLVVNDTRVRRARLHGVDSAGRDIELLVLTREASGDYQCLARPARLATPGAVIRVGADLHATVVAVSAAHRGGRTVSFDAADPDAAIERAGVPPLPPYIHTDLRDPERYQTTYAAGNPDSAAAPTAGLHFTAAVIERLRGAGIGWATLRLDVGLATFAPIRTELCRGSPDARGAVRASCRNRSGDRADATRWWARRRGRHHGRARARDVRTGRSAIARGERHHQPLHPSRASLSRSGRAADELSSATFLAARSARGLHRR